MGEMGRVREKTNLDSSLQLSELLLVAAVEFMIGAIRHRGGGTKRGWRAPSKMRITARSCALRRLEDD